MPAERRMTNVQTLVPNFWILILFEAQITCDQRPYQVHIVVVNQTLVLIICPHTRCSQMMNLSFSQTAAGLVSTTLS